MKRLVFRVTSDNYYESDIDRIVDICGARGFNISRNDARLAWGDYSDSVCASWLFLGDDDDYIFSSIRAVCDAEEDD